MARHEKAFSKSEAGRIGKTYTVAPAVPIAAGTECGEKLMGRLNSTDYT